MKSRDRLPNIVEWQGLKRPLSHSEFKETSFTRSIIRHTYKPLADPQLHVYLGKQQLKSKL